MNYQKIYSNLIGRACGRQLDCYTERHHITPKCMGGSDHWTNLVDLTPEEHYIAHQLLVKIHPEHPSLIFALARMSNKSNKLYGWARRKLADQMKNNNPNAGGHSRRAYIEKYGVPHSGKFTWSEEGLKAVKKRMTQNNPMKGIKPWNHPKATQHTKLIWKNADSYYDWWQNFTTTSPYRMATAFNLTYCMSHSNMLKYFKKGWNPNEDEEWKEFKCKI